MAISMYCLCFFCRDVVRLQHQQRPCQKPLVLGASDLAPPLFHSRDAMSFLPGQQLFVVPALMVDVKVRKRVFLPLNPVVADQLYTGFTKKVLEQGIHAMGEMGMIADSDAVRVVILIVVIETLPHAVETVYQMYPVKMNQMAIWSHAPALRGLDCGGWILPKLNYLFARHMQNSDI
jgi:hypothetical protein